MYVRIPGDWTASYAEVEQTDFCTWHWVLFNETGQALHRGAAVSRRAAVRRARRKLHRYEKKFLPKVVPFGA